MDCDVAYYDMDMRECFPTRISHVRNQGQFGISWAMGLISLLEAKMAKDWGMDMHLPNAFNLSTQELVDKFWGLLVNKPPDSKVDKNGGYSIGLISAFNLVVTHGDKQLLTVSSFTVIHPSEEVIMINIIYKGHSGRSRPPTENDFDALTVMLTGHGISSTAEKYWRFKNSWGKRWADCGFGKILRGPTAYNPKTCSYQLNLLSTVVECGPTKGETVESFAGK
ncbi:uncharacterized protein LOC126691072 [Quercus robur]|uniref:uncharacterized protein LOC126691072 n=1 Tax=Quercus robur TaxID=38942 RepID=UPI002162B144|nr:uncharacterized protein LOC126691072 [Quercus robur]